jgi:hypothetical protein
MAGDAASGQSECTQPGALLYQGKEYPVSISGLSGRGNLEGDRHRRRLQLEKGVGLSGNYVDAQGGAAVGGGGGGVSMRNQHGVVMNITGTGTGVKLALGPKGVDVKLKK